MEKSEYLDKLLKRDFIRYILLKRPEYTDEEVSRHLKSKIDSDLLYDRIKVLIPQVLEKYFTADKCKTSEGKIAETVPAGMDISVADKVEAEYESMIEREYSAINFMPDIIACIERLTWAQGVDDMTKHLRQFQIELRGLSKHFADVVQSTPKYYDLKEKREAAERITPREYLMRDNYKDVADYIEALRLYCRDLCGARLSMQLSRLYSDIADSPEIERLIEKFETLAATAARESADLEGLEAVPEWDEEYVRMLPLSDENITIFTVQSGLSPFAILKSLYSRV
ncbi:MAG: hypothetical protein J1E29_05650 [Duncaniella sp.]|nr:hypothetical protein [Duncaniella sp.]